MNWFAEHRIAWIKESFEIFEALNRRHIMRKFGISLQQATWDLQEVQSRWPDLIEYDGVSKSYKLKK